MKKDDTGIKTLLNTECELIEDIDENIPIQLELSLADLKYLKNLLIADVNEKLLPVIDAVLKEHKQDNSDPNEEFCRVLDEGMAKNKAYWEELKNERIIKNDAMEQNPF